MGRRGSMLLISLVVIIFLSLAETSLFVNGVTQSSLSARTYHRSNALHLAEAGLNQAALNLRTGATTDDVTTAALVTGSFQLEAPPQSMGNYLYRVRSTGTSELEQRQLEGVFRTDRQSVFQFALFGYQWIDIGGSAVTDSYDSCKGTYSSQVPGSKGDTGTNGTTAGSVDFDGTSLLINGTVAVGPNVSNPDSIITNYDASLVTGNPKVASQPVGLLKPSVTIPPCQTALPPLIGGTRTFLTGTDYCPSNTKPITIKGTEVWTANGSISLYFTGELTITGNAVVGVVDQPTMMKWYLTTSTKAPVINGDAKFYGAMYAPNVVAKVNGNAEVFGSVVADQVVLSGAGPKIHYDQCLSGGTGPTGSYKVRLRSWREL